MVTPAMPAPRSQRRREKRQSVKQKTGQVSGPAPVSLQQTLLLRLRRRVRFVLLGTSLVGLVLLRFFNQPVAGWLEHYGFPARLALVLLLLCPALFTWVVGWGELRDLQSEPK